MNDIIADCIEIVENEDTSRTLIGGNDTNIMENIFHYILVGHDSHKTDPCLIGMLQGLSSDADIMYLAGGFCIKNDKAIREVTEQKKTIKLIAFDKLLNDNDLRPEDIFLRAKDFNKQSTDAIEKISDIISKESSSKLIIGNFELPDIDTNDLPLPLFEKIKKKSGKNQIVYIKINEPHKKKTTKKNNETENEFNKMLMTDADVGVLNTQSTWFKNKQIWSIIDNITNGKALAISVNGLIDHFWKTMKAMNAKIPTEEENLVSMTGDAAKIISDEISKRAKITKDIIEPLFHRVAKAVAGVFAFKDSGVENTKVCLVKIIRQSSDAKKSKNKSSVGGDEKTCKITIDEIIQKKPTISIIMGRSCVGKSTLAKQLSDKGFNIIHLDKLIVEIGLENKIKEIYHDSADKDTMDKFIKAIVDRIKNPTVIEGAIKKMSIIEKIIEATGVSNIYIVYIEPENVDTIKRNMTERFKAQLEGNIDNPLPIKMTIELLDDYKKNGMNGELVQEEMKRFAAETMDISKERRELFSETSGGNIIYVLPSESIPTDSNKNITEEKKAGGNIQAGCGCGTILSEKELGISTSGKDLLTLEQMTKTVPNIEKIVPNEEIKLIDLTEISKDLEPEPIDEPKLKLVDLTTTLEEQPKTNQNSLKKVRFVDEEVKKAKKAEKTKEKRKRESAKVTIGGLEYDATGYGVYEVQQRRFRSKHDETFNPFDLYEGQTYTDEGDIAMKMIKKSKINELYDKVIGGLAETMKEYEKGINGGLSDIDEQFVVLSVTSPEIKRSDIDDIDWITSSLSNISQNNDESTNSKFTIQKLVGGSSKKMKRLKLTNTNDCKTRLLELEKKTEPIIKKLEKRITDNINFIEKITLLLKSRIESAKKLTNGGTEYSIVSGDED